MEKKSKKSVIIGITVLLLITLILLGLTYAYYRTRIIGNPNNESISVTSMELEVTYSDGSSMVNMEGNVEPGYTYTKEFSVENTEAATASYTIVLDNVANTFTRTGDWTYTLTETGSTEELASGIINRLEIQTVLANISIDSGEITNYTLEVKYNEKDEDQSVDMSKSMSFRVNIKDASAWDKATEGSLLYALKENNAVVEPLTVPGKEPSATSKTFYEIVSRTDTTNLPRDDEEGYYGFQEKRYLTYASTYTFDEEKGTFTLIDPKLGVHSSDGTVFNDELIGKYVVNPWGNANPEQANSIGLSTIYQIKEVDNTFEGIMSSRKYYFAVKSQVITKTPKSLESVLAATEDDYGISYYFRGTVENNYVNYSGMCWRIVRVDGNGNIKLALADENGECNATTYSVDNPESAFVDGRTNIAYSYRYEGLRAVAYEESNIPAILNTWASKKIKNSDGTTLREQNLDTSKLVTAEWCNDMSIPHKGTHGASFGADIRLGNPETANPTLKCNSIGIEESTNAKKYSSYIGMLTADEVAFAGGRESLYGYFNYYLKTNATGAFYWTLSPASIDLRDWLEGDDYYGVARVYTVQSYGSLRHINVDLEDDDPDSEYEASVRPVILLKSDVLVTTSAESEYAPGTYQNPYVVG